jgi:hypothetical protein
LLACAAACAPLLLLLLPHPPPEAPLPSLGQGFSQEQHHPLLLPAYHQLPLLLLPGHQHLLPVPLLAKRHQPDRPLVPGSTPATSVSSYLHPLPPQPLLLLLLLLPPR